MKILIVDDDLANCQLIKHLLASFCEPDIVTNGEKAVNAFLEAHKSKAPYDVIFLDIMMPEKDGHQVLQEIRDWEAKNLKYGEGEGESKIVMVSALDSKDHILSSFKEGCEFFLVKPISKSKVLNVMAEMGYKT
ncbi:MAG: response regulator [Proteobacteria bacterium]|nr:response regulator [Pseudomonadota bacterium]